MDKLFIHNIAWGPLYNQMLFDYCIPSLVGDVQMLIKEGVQIEWDVNTDDTREHIPYEGVNIRYSGVQDIIGFNENIWERVKAAVSQDSYIAIIAPDNVFARGSLYNAYMMARHKDTSIAIAHPRVNCHSFIKEFPAGKVFEKRELVSIAMRPDMMHGAFANAFDDNDANITEHGISIRKITDKHYAVVHAIPSPMIFHLNSSDVDYLKSAGYGNIDRGLSKRLYDEQRIKLVGSSDIAFFIELTRPETNMPPINSGKRYNDRNIEQSQNIFNNMIVSWIGE
jgi:hypothetical protein